MPNKTSFSLTWLMLFAGLFVLFVGTSSPCRADDTYTTLIGNANQLLKAGKLADARQVATTATLIFPDRFEAYFIAGVVAHQQGADADARPLIEKALALAPEEKKPKIQKFLDTLGSANIASAAAAPAAAPAPAGPPPLDATAQRKLDALLLIPQEADAATSPDDRQALLNEFMEKSAAFAQAHPEQTVLWVLRAAAAIELDDKQSGRAAARRLLTVTNPDEKTRKVLAMLERKDWLEGVEPWKPIRLQLPDGPQPPADWVGKTLQVASAANLPMLWVAPGTFTMGGASDGSAHVVHITRGFWLGRTEVTQSQWQTVMGSNPSHKNFQGQNQPVEKVSWNDAMEFCRRVTASEKAAGHVLPGYEYTLPTEAEWEYACRAGTTGDYAGDGNLDHMGWYDKNSEGKTHNVAGKQPNTWGLYDMHGNVWEWCYDYYRPFSNREQTDSNREQTDPAVIDVDPDDTSDSDTARAGRGGGWGDSAGLCRSAYRFGYDPSQGDDDLGFRFALAPSRTN
jgi:formylglycine-generating enzyme required for sulfatase activity